MRLIDADALYFAQRYARTDPDSDKVIPVLAVDKTAIDNAPTIEAEPVRHGRWIGLEYDGYADGCPVYDLWECSECGEEVSGEDVPITHPYCHGCGAKMDQKGECL